MNIDERIEQFLEQHSIRVTIKRVGFTRQEMEHEVYSTKNNKFEVKIYYRLTYRVFPVYTGYGLREITTSHAIRDILHHVGQISGSPDFDYWFKQCGGDDMYAMLLDDKEDSASKRDTMNYCKRYFRFCKNMQDKMLELLGEETFETFLNLDQGDA